jgi:hypothetical protein
VAVNPAYPEIRVLVFGGREYAYEAFVHEEIILVTDGVPFENVTIIHGDANRERRIGADYFAHTFCDVWRHEGIIEKPYPAKWDDLDVPGAVIRTRAKGRRYNVVAGFQRNQQMLDDGKPTHARGFPGGNGTADMRERIELAIKHGAIINFMMLS